jgi:hypothetical protein
MHVHWVKILESKVYLQQWHKCRWFYCRSHMHGRVVQMGGMRRGDDVHIEGSKLNTQAQLLNYLQILETEQGATEIKILSDNSPRFTAARGRRPASFPDHSPSLLQFLLISRTHSTRAYVQMRRIDQWAQWPGGVVGYSGVPGTLPRGLTLALGSS